MSKLTHSLLLGASCAFALPALVSAQQINFLDGVALPDSGGEILSYYSAGGTGFIASTYSSGTSGAHGVRLTQLQANGSLSSPAVAQIDLGSTFGATGVFSLSSVQVDNQGRDFGVATLIPGAAGEQRGSVLGKAVFFQLSTGSVLGSVDVGYHPDSVTITPDGNRLVIANEGEFISNAGPQTPGSVSVVQLTGVTSAADLGTKLAASQIGVTGVDISSSARELTEMRSRLRRAISSITTNVSRYISLRIDATVASMSLMPCPCRRSCCTISVVDVDMPAK